MSPRNVLINHSIWIEVEQKQQQQQQQSVLYSCIYTHTRTYIHLLCSSGKKSIQSLLIKVANINGNSEMKKL